MQPLSIYDDTYFMRQALQEAQIAYERGEIPVGAVVVSRQRIIARTHNQTELLKDITAHAEVLAITAAANYLDSKYLTDCTLYVTLEPCPMCAGALAWSQISRIVYGAADAKRGFMRFGKQMLHPKTRVEYGIEREQCAALMKRFFSERR